ncbi:MAG: hypothetical protein WA192_09575 [Candidatus Acidiferrales bacterium]
MKYLFAIAVLVLAASAAQAQDTGGLRALSTPPTVDAQMSNVPPTIFPIVVASGDNSTFQPNNSFLSWSDAIELGKRQLLPPTTVAEAARRNRQMRLAAK